MNPDTESIAPADIAAVGRDAEALQEAHVDGDAGRGRRDRQVDVADRELQQHERPERHRPAHRADGAHRVGHPRQLGDDQPPQQPRPAGITHLLDERVEVHAADEGDHRVRRDSEQGEVEHRAERDAPQLDQWLLLDAERAAQTSRARRRGRRAGRSSTLRIPRGRAASWRYGTVAARASSPSVRRAIATARASSSMAMVRARSWARSARSARRRWRPPRPWRSHRSRPCRRARRTMRSKSMSEWVMPAAPSWRNSSQRPSTARVGQVDRSRRDRLAVGSHDQQGVAVAGAPGDDEPRRAHPGPLGRAR